MTNIDLVLTAITLWREARGESDEGRRAVAHVIANRAAVQGKAAADICTAKMQFSSMTAPGDSQLVLWPKSGDLIYASCEAIAEAVLSGSDPDNTGGADHYFNPSVVLPSWAAGMTKTVSIGHHDFYKS